MRVRIKSINPKLSADIIQRLASVASRHVSEDIAVQFSVESYVRELERYGGHHLLDRCEALWMAETIVISQSLQKIDPASALYWQVVAVAADGLLQALGVDDLEARLRFATAASSGYLEEFAFSTNEKKRVGRIFSSAKPSLAGSDLSYSEAPACIDFFEANRLASCEVFPFIKAWPERKKYDFIWSLVHMRFNRLLVQDLRLQEAIIWDLLRRSYARVFATSNLSKEARNVEFV